MYLCNVRSSLFRVQNTQKTPLTTVKIINVTWHSYCAPHILVRYWRQVNCNSAGSVADCCLKHRTNQCRPGGKGCPRGSIWNGVTDQHVGFRQAAPGPGVGPTGWRTRRLGRHSECSTARRLSCANRSGQCCQARRWLARRIQRWGIQGRLPSLLVLSTLLSSQASLLMYAFLLSHLPFA